MENRRFWKWVTLFAYRRWSRGEVPGRKPVGVPGNRDPDHPCDMYAPRERLPGEWADCMTDGHYLCGECAHRDTARGPDDAIVRNWIELSIPRLP